MAKKQIKELVILTKMQGGREATEQVKSLEAALDSVTKSAVVTNRELGGSVKVSQNVAKAYLGISKAMESVVTSSKALNKALNGDTKTATKNLNAYIDNLQIATIYMQDLSTQAAKAAHSVSMVGDSSTNSELKSMVNFLEQIYNELIDLNDGSRETIHTLDRLGDRIVDVEVQTKKTRLEIERLTTAYDSNTKSGSRAGAGTNKLANDVRRLGGAGSQGARAFSALAFQMNPLVSLYATIAVNVYALTEAFRILNAAANLSRLQDQTAKFASSLSGINIKGLSQDLQELSGYAISSADALRQTVRGVSYGFLVEDMERLTVGARKASIALGIDFADAMDRAFRGISKGEVEVLDEIGVVTRLDTAYTNYAVTLNKSADALTEVERRQALTNEVISQLESRFSAFDVAASGMEALGVATKDALDNMLVMAATSFDGTANSIAGVLKGFSGVRSASEKVIESQKTYNEAIKAGRYSQAAVALDDYRKALVEVSKQNQVGTKEHAEYKKSQEAAANSANILSKSIAGLIVYATVYATTVLVSFIANTYKAVASVVSHVAANLSLAAAGNANILWTTVYTGLLRVKSAAIYVATSAVLLYSTAMTAGAAATWALLAPLLIVAAKIAAVVGVVYAIGAGFNWLSKTLFDFDAFDWIAKKVSWLGDKIGDFLSWLGFKAAEAGGDIVDNVSSGLDKVSSGIGLDAKLASLFKINQGELDKITADQVDSYIYSLQSAASNAGPVSFSMELDGNQDSGRGLGIDRNEAENNLKYLGSVSSAIQSIEKEVNELSSYDTSVKRLAGSFRDLAAMPISLKLDPQGFKEAEIRFENLKTKGIIPIDVQWDGGKGLTEFNNRVQKAAEVVEEYDRRGAFMLDSFNAALDSSDPTANIKSVGKELELINKVIQAQASLGDSINSNDRQALEDKAAILELKKAELEIDNRLRVTFDAQEISLAKKLAARSTEIHLQSDLVKLELDSLMLKEAALTAEGRNTEEIRKQVELMKIKLGIAKSEESAAGARASFEFNIAQQEKRVASAGSAKGRVAEQEKLLELKRQDAELETDAISRAKALMELGAEKNQLDRDKQASPFADAGTSLSSISSIGGLTDLQSNFTSTLGTLSTTYSDFLSSMDSQSMSFTEYLGGNLDALANVGQAALGMAQSIFSEISASKIESINQEIAAEQRRDGKSAESLAKIKKLNAQRIKEETKAKKASVLMSTATAIMQAMAQIPYPANIAVAAATGVMGMLQLANIDKAANGQLAALNGGGGDLSISAGNRDNSIDVSKSANAGELGYLQGQAGTGTASNFTPGRAGGNYAMAGAAITVGESGPEVIVPKVPVSVQPAGSTVGTNITFSPQFNLSAVDTAGMDELMYKYSRSLYNGLERELNANNLSLDSLRM